MGLFTVFQHWREPTIRRGAWVMVLSAVCVFFVFNTTFGFTNVWWGPRWLLPVAPLMAILIGVLVNEVFEVLKPMHGHARALVVSNPLPTHAASLLLAIILAGMVLVGPTAYLTKFWEVKTMPPHGVTHKIHQRVMEMGLGNAVVGMSTAGGLIPPDARSGMVMMTVPFEANPVIYVRTIPAWQTKALTAYPGRQLYEVSTDPSDVNNFVIKQLTPNEQ
ncbi:MAG: hypothetical protein HC828_10220 [Blastochloris sp.]|nr:hypothetical protein [Blastochloris sp.]